MPSSDDAATRGTHGRGWLLGLPATLQRLTGMIAELRADLESGRAAVDELSERIDGLSERMDLFNNRSAAEYDRMMRALRLIRDDDARNWERLWQARREPDYELAFTEPEPLVTFFIPTWRSYETLRDRAIPSILAQTYANWELLIVGDAAPPQTGEVIAAFDDERIRFVNLPHRGPYPESREDAWFISGTFPFNTGLQLARGRWWAGMADDDALVPGFLESMLDLARREHAEVAYGRVRAHDPSGDTRLIGRFPPEYTHWHIQGALVHGALRYLPLLPSDWVFSVPNDWSWAERMLRIGVRFAMTDEVTAEYFPSKVWTNPSAAE